MPGVGGATANRYSISGGDENIFNLDSGTGCVTCENTKKTTDCIL